MSTYGYQLNIYPVGLGTQLTGTGAYVIQSKEGQEHKTQKISHILCSIQTLNNLIGSLILIEHNQLTTPIR